MNVLNIVKLKQLIVSGNTNDISIYLIDIKNRLMELSKPSLMDAWKDNLVNLITVYIKEVSNGNCNSTLVNETLATILTEVATGYRKNKNTTSRYETFNVTELLNSCSMFNTRYTLTIENSIKADKNSIKADAFYYPYGHDTTIQDLLRDSLNRTLVPDDMIKRKLMSADICEVIASTKDKLNDCLLGLTIKYNETINLGDTCITNKTVVELTLPSTGKSFTGVGEDLLSALLFMLDDYSVYAKQYN